MWSSQALAKIKSLVLGTLGLILGLRPFGGSFLSIASCSNSTWWLAFVTLRWFLMIILRIFWCMDLSFLVVPRVVVDVELSIALFSVVSVEV